ncbi:MAG: hypothetical protein FJZ90_09320 [Chloroflexi bacterium]|nr:hypothetical protein [Chloroflexota bacterium]
MSLVDWLGKGWLTSHQTSRQEIANLLALEVAQTPPLAALGARAIMYTDDCLCSAPEFGGLRVRRGGASVPGFKS